uniref:Protein kinase domain-containing protein n=1 Tax=Oryza punctata TaxID=4537 RepID=A0A0E0JJT7_ORYPU
MAMVASACWPTMATERWSTLRQQPIIHRNIRSSNVLLTDTLTAKMAGVGIARMADGESSESERTRRPHGPGLQVPEYLSTYELTDKSDVYSFGILYVELVTGRPPIECRRDLDRRPTTKWCHINAKQTDPYENVRIHHRQPHDDRIRRRGPARHAWISPEHLVIFFVKPNKRYVEPLGPVRLQWKKDRNPKILISLQAKV